MSKDQKEQQILGAKIVAELQACRDLIRDMGASMRDNREQIDEIKSELSAVKARVSIVENQRRQN